MCDRALALALVRAHLLTDPEYVSYVAPHSRVRRHEVSPVHSRYSVERVGGHVRRAPHAKRSIDAIACVCKQPVVYEPRWFEPPVGRKRNR